MDPFQSKIVAIEIHSTKPIHLRIEEPSAQVKIRTSEIKMGLLSIRFYTGNRSTLNKNTYRISSPWYFALNNHFIKIFQNTPQLCWADENRFAEGEMVWQVAEKP
jgi:hypothetical protein